MGRFGARYAAAPRRGRPEAGRQPLTGSGRGTLRRARLLLGLALFSAAVAAGCSFSGVQPCRQHRATGSILRRAAEESKEEGAGDWLKAIREALGGNEAKLEQKVKEETAKAEEIAQREAELQGRLNKQMRLTGEAEDKAKPLYAQVEEMKSQVSALQRSYQDLTDALEFAQVENESLKTERDALATKLEEVQRRAEQLQAQLDEQQAQSAEATEAEAQARAEAAEAKQTAEAKSAEATAAEAKAAQAEAKAAGAEAKAAGAEAKAAAAEAEAKAATEKKGVLASIKSMFKGKKKD